MSFDLNEHDDRRPGFRIARNCGTCKHSSLPTRRGHCLHPSVLPKDFSILVPRQKPGAGRPQMIKFNANIKKKLLSTHIMAVCDKHEYKRNIQSLNPITRYCGARVQKQYDFL